MHAAQPSDFRPICVLSMIYRTWGSYRARDLLDWIERCAPEQLVGNRPGKSTANLWWQIAMLAEEAHHHGHELAGLVTDVTKCYNTIPRQVVYIIARRIGIPPNFLECWMQAINRLQRMFVISGACSAAVSSTCGFPEGDALSVLSMVLVNLSFHAITNQEVSPGWVYSYVDNWEMITEDASQVARADQAFRHFADMTGLGLDVRKTYAWSTHGTGRKLLKSQGFTVLLDAKDLGGHMQYSQRHTMFTVRARIQGCQDLWTWLRRSPAPVSQKLRIIVSTAWPRCLYGACIIRLGKEHFKKMRAAAMAALGWNKKGASSLLQFGLIQQCQLDPEATTCWQTLVAFRVHADHATAFALLDDLVTQPPKRYKPGPCSTLLERLHSLQWQWKGNGYIEDHWHCVWSLVDVSPQLLSLKFAQAWSLRVGTLLCHRDTFQGLHLVDRGFTLAQQKQWPDDKAALMRTSMNGTFYTRDKQVHSGKFADASCPWCGSADSLEHRLWHCPGFAEARSHVTVHQREQLFEYPECTYLHGWFLVETEYVQYAQALARHHCSEEVEVPAATTEPWQLFVDGACQHPKEPVLRLGTWGVVCADLSHDSFHAVASGLLPGMFHTALRAEIYAAWVAVSTAVSANHKFMLWTDNQVVYDRILGWLHSKGKTIGPSSKDCDLWKPLRQAVKAAHRRCLFLHVIKVRSHENAAAYTDHLEQWVIRGNAAVDHLAEQAVGSIPHDVWRTWRAACHKHALLTPLREAMHTLLFQVGKKAVECKGELRQRDQQEFHQASVVQPELRQSFEPLPEDLTGLAVPSLEPHKWLVFDWLKGIQSGDDTEMCWLCGHQLLCLFQACTNHVGFMYSRNKYLEVARHDGHAFNRLASWFCAMLKALARGLGLPIICERRPPSGSSYRSWQGCILVRVSRCHVDQVDRLFCEAGVTPIVNVSRAFNRDLFFGNA
eukprot:Skav235522  [mRNA]  locus=scaffold625:1016263:1019103:- [translate_table: standard]